MHRAKIVFGHLTQCPAAARPNSVQRAECKSFPRASPDDIVVVHGLRTAIGKAKRGAFFKVHVYILMRTAQCCRSVLLCIDMHCEQNVLFRAAGSAQYCCASIYTVNRMCSSGLQALHSVAGHIRNGSYDIGLACGVESMSLHSPGNPGDVSSRLMDNEKVWDCLIPMGITSKNVAERFGISRQKQDAFAVSSQQKSLQHFLHILPLAGKAQKLGLFAWEIVPVSTKFEDSEGNETRITVTQDDGIRAGTTLEGLAKLRPAFKENGSTTAGNGSQVSNGVAAVLVARRSAAQQLGLPVLGVLRASAVVGVPPDDMGIGPAYAIPIALQQAGLTVDDIDVFEINEAFASQALYFVEKLGIPLDKLNPSGGAIALGHPLGCTGARQVVTLLIELKCRGRRAYGVVSMCIGTGMGAAAVFEYPGQSNLQKVQFRVQTSSN
ncbi:3-ketoacyl-CoA thiolase A [Huso huso]|uniref:3-ketoacyl-CoA thiolase A n=1 Tax=Huso huso TaxID=61971 RepID=A0ABR1A536_HUSHU